jgi:hypothetical protein
MEGKCISCGFFKLIESEKEKQLGVCKRFPPMPFLYHDPNKPGKAMQITSNFPPVAADTYCGEFRHIINS